MSKGSTRRPQFIDDREAELRWAMAFGKTAEERSEAAVEWHRLRQRQMWDETKKRNLGETK